MLIHRPQGFPFASPAPEKSYSVRKLTREALEAVLGFKVADFELYRSAFVHKSATNDTGLQSYERQEFLGDVAVSFIVSKYLFDTFPKANEGFLTRVRTKLVSGEFLAKLARCLGLQDFVVMNRKAMEEGWNNNERILGDVFESLLCSIYLDLSLMTAKHFLLTVIERYSDFQDILRDTNYKDLLMRFAQGRNLPLPEYRMLNDPQQSRRPTFHVTALLGGVRYGDGCDTSKKGAEQKAAYQALRRLGAPIALIE